MLWYLFIYKGKMGIVSAVSVDKIAIPFDDLLYYWRGDIVCSLDECYRILRYSEDHHMLPTGVEWNYTKGN